MRAGGEAGMSIRMVLSRREVVDKTEAAENREVAGFRLSVETAIDANGWDAVKEGGDSF